MKKKLHDIIGKKTLYLDGGMGTLLQGYGLKIGEYPETFNISHPEIIKKIHMEYLAAGSNIITLNTFGAFSFRFPNQEDIIGAAVKAGADAIKDSSAEAYMALDLAPTGRLLKPFGDLEFEECYNFYKEPAIIAEKHGVDLVIIETMSDALEIKAAVLAVKENTGLPIVCSLTFDAHGRTMTGCDFQTMITLLEGLGVDVIGINCGYGPEIMQPFVPRIMQLISTPLLVQPNAGLPQMVDGRAVYDLSAADFASAMNEILKSGASLLGGCCGTTPGHIREMIKLIESEVVNEALTKEIAGEEGGLTVKSSCFACSYSKSVNISEIQLPKPITDDNLDDIIDEGLSRIDSGDEIISLDVSAAANEDDLLPQAVRGLQEITNIPLHIISSNPLALENALRIYNGKCALSITGCSDTVRREIEAIIKKYGAAVC